MEEIALALGGGGIKGIAHLGVVFALQDAGYRIGAIAGTSSGGIAGAAIASGADRSALYDAIRTIQTSNFFSRQEHDGPSLLGLSGVVKMLSPFLNGKTFDDLNIPFAVTAVDIKTRQEYILNRGSVIDAVVATSSIPGVFPPVKMGAAELVDGGVVDPVPVAVTRWMAPKLPIIAVCLSPTPEKWAELPDLSVPIETKIPQTILQRVLNLRIGQAIRIFVESYDITTHMITELRLQVEKPDVVIRPDLVKYGILEKVDPDIYMRLGKEAVEKALPEIEEKLSWRHKLARQFQNPQPPSKFLEDNPSIRRRE